MTYKTWAAALMLSLVGVSAAGAQDAQTETATEPDPFVEGLKTLPGTYAGDYFCRNTGAHGLTLKVEAMAGTDMTAGAYPVSATLWFYPLMSNPDAPKGAFYMEGTLDEFGQLQLLPTDWIEQPSNYGAAEIDGAYDADDKVIRGKPAGRGAAATGCLALNLTRLADVE